MRSAQQGEEFGDRGLHQTGHVPRYRRLNLVLLAVMASLYREMQQEMDEVLRHFVLRYKISDLAWQGNRVKEVRDKVLEC